MNKAHGLMLIGPWAQSDMVPSCFAPSSRTMEVDNLYTIFKAWAAHALFTRHLHLIAHMLPPPADSDSDDDSDSDSDDQTSAS